MAMYPSQKVGGGTVKTTIWDSGDITSSDWVADGSGIRLTCDKVLSQADKTIILNALNTYKYGQLYIETFFTTGGGTRTILLPIDIGNTEFINGALFGGSHFQYDVSINLVGNMIYHNLSGDYMNDYKQYTYRSKIIAIQ